MIQLRKFKPLEAGHPLLDDAPRCPFCHAEWQVGDVTALWPTIPAGNDEHAKATAGRAYTSEAAVVHADCVPEGMVEWE